MYLHICSYFSISGIRRKTSGSNLKRLQLATSGGILGASTRLIKVSEFGPAYQKHQKGPAGQLCRLVSVGKVRGGEQNKYNKKM